MARMRERIFAGFGAFLFLASACAVTVYAIIQTGSSNTTPTTPTQTSQSNCDISTPVAAAPVTEPAAYKPDGAVTSLQTTDVTTGSGPAAKDGDCLVMKYAGNLASNGTIFDENYSKQTALQFTLGAGEVIKGWDQGLVGMKAGGTRRLLIPSALGYGSTGSGSTIPPNSDLVFTVQLLKIKS